MPVNKFFWLLLFFPTLILSQETKDTIVVVNDDLFKFSYFININYLDINKINSVLDKYFFDKITEPDITNGFELIYSIDFLNIESKNISYTLYPFLSYETNNFLIGMNDLDDNRNSKLIYNNFGFGTIYRYYLSNKFSYDFQLALNYNWISIEASRNPTSIDTLMKYFNRKDSYFKTSNKGFGGFLGVGINYKFPASKPNTRGFVIGFSVKIYSSLDKFLFGTKNITLKTEDGYILEELQTNFPFHYSIGLKFSYNY